MPPDHRPADADAAFDASGVDRTLVREFLARTPVERLERAEAMARAVLEVRKLNGIPTVR